MVAKKWDYNSTTFENVDTTAKDGLLNPTELESYFKTLYTDTNTQSNYQSPNDYLARADINGDGLISKGEIALYKSGQDYLDKDTFITKVNTDTTTNQTQWDDLQKEYNIYDSKDIISKGEIMDHDKELYREAMKFSSETFNAADANKDGFLNRSEMKTYLENLYGTCNDKQINYAFNNLDLNKDGLISDGELALFKTKNADLIDTKTLTNAGYSQADADALVKKYASEGQSAFNANDVKDKDGTLQDKSNYNKPKDGISVGGIIALVVFCLIVVGIIAWGIWWLSKDDKKETKTNENQKAISEKSENNLATINNVQWNSIG